MEHVRETALLKLNAGGSSADGQLSAFNDAGQLAFAARFADGSEAVIVATIVAEPATLVLYEVAIVFWFVLGRTRLCLWSGFYWANMNFSASSNLTGPSQPQHQIQKWHE